MQQLRQHSLDLHARRETLQLDAWRNSATRENEHVALELGVSVGGFEKGQQVGHEHQVGDTTSRNMLQMFYQAKPKALHLQVAALVILVVANLVFVLAMIGNRAIGFMAYSPNMVQMTLVMR